MKKIIVSEPVYKTKLILVWDCKVSELPKLFPKIDKDFEFTDDRVGSFFENDNEQLDLIRTKHIDRMDIIVHELLHFVIAMGKRYGFDTDGGEEFYCYLMDYYYKIISKKILQHNK